MRLLTLCGGFWMLEGEEEDSNPSCTGRGAGTLIVRSWTLSRTSTGLPLTDVLVPPEGTLQFQLCFTQFCPLLLALLFLCSLSLRLKGAAGAGGLSVESQNPVDTCS